MMPNQQETAEKEARMKVVVGLVREGQEFQPKFVKLLAENSNVGTIEGMAALAHNAQRDLYLTSGLNRGDVGRDVANARTEMGSRVVATLLDRSNVDVGYEIGNLGSWLRAKGLDVERSGGEREIRWSKGRGGTAGKQEKDSYFKDEVMSLGGTKSIFDYLGVKCMEMAARHADSDSDVQVLGLAGAVARTVAMEIESVVATGKPLAKEMYKAMLGGPLESCNIKIVDKDKTGK